ncbi:diacylglycerol kinase [Spartinivicinus poritis]|uniref:Diacylglycerol kinase n=1 Tax=Spartinivicinus poritis TaxID=2994640 RepID=A0ABT5UBQ6_9GAMM|nr:diacylglycerol kinase [Spartinivicinus sp. A2-2]MDE1463810.1 diacylglycerol kinase [Spartinivicinus sp. A2-2]
MNSTKPTGINRLIKATLYSWQGLKAAYQNEQAFKQESWLLLVLTPIAIWLGDNALEVALLIGSILLVMIVELLNSAIEAVVDRVSDERHPLSGRAKDMGSAAVMVALMCAGLVWLGVLLS